MVQKNQKDSVQKTEGELVRDNQERQKQEQLDIDSYILDIENQIVSLFDKGISPDYVTLESLHNEYVGKNNFNVYIYTLSDEKVHSLSDSSTIPRQPDVAGVAITGLCSKSELVKKFEDLTFSVDEVLRETKLDESHFPVSIGKSLTVDPKHRGKGIGLKLAIHSVSFLRKHPPAIGTMWAKGEDNMNKEMEEFMESAGAECIARYDSMWRDGWRCVECGVENECKCGCIVYALGV